LLSRMMNVLEYKYIVQNVLKHLEVREVLRLSVVSRTWNDATQKLTFHPTIGYLRGWTLTIGEWDVEFEEIAPSRRDSVMGLVKWVTMNDMVESLDEMMDKIPRLPNVRTLDFDDPSDQIGLCERAAKKLQKKIDLSRIELLAVAGTRQCENVIQKYFTGLRELHLICYEPRPDFSQLPHIHKVLLDGYNELPDLYGKVDTLELEISPAEFTRFYDVSKLHGVKNFTLQLPHVPVVSAGHRDSFFLYTIYKTLQQCLCNIESVTFRTYSNPPISEHILYNVNRQIPDPWRFRQADGKLILSSTTIS